MSSVDDVFTIALKQKNIPTVFWRHFKNTAVVLYGYSVLLRSVCQNRSHLLCASSKYIHVRIGLGPNNPKPSSDIFYLPSVTNSVASKFEI